MTLENLQVLITANTSQLQQEINKTQKQIQGISKTAQSTSSGLTSAVMKGTVATKILSAGISVITSNLDDAIKRLDTLNNYPKVMSNLGISTKEADASLKRLSEGLNGLPTTMDDAVGSVQRFTSANGNIKASTEMFLALNNAILSGGASTQMQASALEQLSQAYAKGKPDMMEWRTAMSTMPAQLKQIAIAMGYADASQLGESLRNGTVSMDEFMKKIIELNKTGANGFKSFEEQARNSTGGVATSMTLVKTALTRGLADIMNAIGQSNIAGFFQGIAKAINSVVPYIVKFVKICVAGVSAIAGLFGKKISAQVSTQAETTADSIESIGTSATDTAKDMDKTTGSANKLNKALNGLAGFDEMNVLKEADTGSGGSGSSDVGGASGVGDLSGLDWDITEQLDDNLISLDAFQNKLEEVFNIIREGFSKSFGNTNFDGIIQHFEGIKDSLISIWTDSNVVNSVQQWVNTAIYTLGSVTGSIAKIGTNVAEVYVGYIQKFLNQSGGRIKKYISNMFDISTKDIKIVGSVYDAIAQISDAVNNDTTKQIGADLLSAIYNPLMSLSETFFSFTSDMYEMLVVPIIDNVELIKETFNNLLTPISSVFNDLNDAFTHFGDLVNGVYNDYLKPFFNDIKTGLSDTFKKFLDSYNTYVVPFIDKLASGINDIWNNYLKPLWDNIAEFIGHAVELIQLIWNNYLKPLIDWIAQKIVPVVVPILQQVWNTISTIFKLISNAINTLLGVINGIITFVKGVFTGDWETAWNGISKIFSSVWNGIKNFLSTIINFIKNSIDNSLQTIKNIISAIMDRISSTISSVTNGIWNGIKGVINCIIGGLNKLIQGVNKIRFDVPDWVPAIGGKKWGFNIPQIPQLARGGVVDKPTIAMIGEQGKEAIVPLENNLGFIDKLADKINSFSTDNNGQPIQIVLKVGEDTLLNKIIEGLKEKSFEKNGEVFDL